MKNIKKNPLRGTLTKLWNKFSESFCEKNWKNFQKVLWNNSRNNIHTFTIISWEISRGLWLKSQDRRNTEEKSGRNFRYLPRSQNFRFFSWISYEIYPRRKPMTPWLRSRLAAGTTCWIQWITRLQVVNRNTRICQRRNYKIQNW